jgi:hypothetical protein
VVRLIDRWSLLNLPLVVFLSVPSGEGADPQAGGPARVVGSDVTPQRQSRVVQQLTTLIAAKPSVHGVVWRQVRDAAPHEFPHGGLLDHGERPKPALSALAAYRREHLI